MVARDRGPVRQALVPTHERRGGQRCVQVLELTKNAADAVSDLLKRLYLPFLIREVRASRFFHVFRLARPLSSPVANADIAYTPVAAARWVPAGWHRRKWLAQANGKFRSSAVAAASAASL
jgi:hypothetical protein